MLYALRASPERREQVSPAGSNSRTLAARSFEAARARPPSWTRSFRRSIRGTPSHGRARYGDPQATRVLGRVRTVAESSAAVLVSHGAPVIARIAPLGCEHRCCRVDDGHPPAEPARSARTFSSCRRPACPPERLTSPRLSRIRNSQSARLYEQGYRRLCQNPC